MAKVTVWGDFRVESVKHLNLSGELQLLLNQSDVNILNFEAPIFSKGKAIRKSGPNLSQHMDAPAWVEEHGFNIISCANNHMMDYGEDGLNATINSFNTAKVIGGGNWEDAYKIQIIETKDGLRIGFLAATHREFGNLVKKADCVGCAWCMHPFFEQQIIMSKYMSIDFLVVINHAGVEYIDYPLPEWRETYRKWIDFGADAVIASHPHVPQGWEIYKGKPICYSLGNFCFQTNKISHKYWNESLCCILDLKKKTQQSKEISMSIRPVYYDYKTQYISDNTSIKFSEHMKELNAIYMNEELYLDKIEKCVRNILPHYYGMFARSGFVNTAFSFGLLKGIIEGFKKEHILNCIRCESHRWAIARAIESTIRNSSDGVE